MLADEITKRLKISDEGHVLSSLKQFLVKPTSDFVRATVRVEELESSGDMAKVDVQAYFSLKAFVGAAITFSLTNRFIQQSERS